MTDRESRMPGLSNLTGRPARILASKVPAVTVLFWIIKVLTTGMGETASDYLTHRFDPVLTAGVAGLVCLFAFVLQFSMRRYVTWIYWFAVVMVSVFGTMVADALHVGFGIPYAVSAAGFGLILAVVLIVWYSSEKTLSIHSITTRRRETFYWATILTTFAFGTAAGDLTATTLNLGYLGSGVLFAVLIAIPAVGFWRFHLNPVVAFWSAYILTRPLGASFADWVAVPASRGGLDWGTGPVTLVLLLLIAGCVGYLSISAMDVATPPADTGSGADGVLVGPVGNSTHLPVVATMRGDPRSPSSRPHLSTDEVTSMSETVEVQGARISPGSSSTTAVVRDRDS